MKRRLLASFVFTVLLVGSVIFPLEIHAVSVPEVSLSFNSNENSVVISNIFYEVEGNPAFLQVSIAKDGQNISSDGYNSQRGYDIQEKRAIVFNLNQILSEPGTYEMKAVVVAKSPDGQETGRSSEAFLSFDYAGRKNQDSPSQQPQTQQPPAGSAGKPLEEIEIPRVKIQYDPQEKAIAYLGVEYNIGEYVAELRGSLIKNGKVISSFTFGPSMGYHDEGQKLVLEFVDRVLSAHGEGTYTVKAYHALIGDGGKVVKKGDSASLSFGYPSGTIVSSGNEQSQGGSAPSEPPVQSEAGTKPAEENKSSESPELQTPETNSLPETGSEQSKQEDTNTSAEVTDQNKPEESENGGENEEETISDDTSDSLEEKSGFPAGIGAAAFAVLVIIAAVFTAKRKK